MIFPAFKAGDSALREPSGGFDSHTLPPGSNSVLFGKESNFRPSIPSATSQTVTVCIVCRQDSEDTNEYAEAGCTLFNMTVTGLAWNKDFE